MPSFSDLRSDYPLNFSLFACLFSGVLKHRFGATVVPLPPVGLPSRTGENVWSVSWVLAQAIPSYSRDFADNNGKHHCILSEHRTHLTAQCCSSERNPPTNKSTHSLAQATPSVAQFWSRSIALLAHSSDRHRTNLRGNIGACLCELTASLQLRKAAACTGVDVQMVYISRRRSHEQLAHSPDCLRAHLRGNKEVSWYELTASSLFGKSPACDVLVAVLRIPPPDSWAAAVPGERCESAGTAHEVRTRYPWLSMNGLPWFVGLIFESSGPGPNFEVVAQTHVLALSSAPIWQRGELAHSHSVRHRSNRTVAPLNENQPPDVQQRTGQFVGASRTEINRYG